MPLLKRRPKKEPRPQASPMEDALHSLREQQRLLADIGEEIRPLLAAQQRALAATRSPTSSTTDDEHAAREAADYFLGKSGRDAIETRLSALEEGDREQATDQRIGELAAGALSQRLGKLQATQAAFVAGIEFARYRALRAYAEQIDAKRLKLVQADARLLAEFYAVADMIEPLAKTHEKRGAQPIAAEGWRRPLWVEHVPTMLRPLGEYSAVLDATQIGAAREAVEIELRALGILA